MRARNLKPGFFKNESLSECDPLARILFIGLWCLADREGRLEDRPKRIKGEILPYDDCNIDEYLTQLHEKGFLIRYSVDCKEYIQINNFVKHQNPHIKETVSQIPVPIGYEDSGTVPYYVTPKTRNEIIERDGYKCVECGYESSLMIDHIIPRSRGGSNEKENLRTLCNKCNSGKGNRINVLSKSTGNSHTSTGNSHASPEKHQTRPAESLLLNPESPIPHSDTYGKAGLSPCPHQEIIEIYHTTIPELPRVAKWTPKRVKHLQTCWADKNRQSLEWWQKYFTKIRDSDFLMGRSNGFKADLEWLTIEGNLIKVVEGRYENQPEPESPIDSWARKKQAEIEGKKNGTV